MANTFWTALGTSISAALATSAGIFTIRRFTSWGQRNSILTGVLAALGMVLHEFPEGIITYLLLLRGGLGGRQAMLLAFLAAAATTPLGMLVSYPLISRIGSRTLGALLALSAGALLYVGATHLLPRAEQDYRRFSLVALAGSVVVAVIIVLSKT